MKKKRCRCSACKKLITAKEFVYGICQPRAKNGGYNWHLLTAEQTLRLGLWVK